MTDSQNGLTGVDDQECLELVGEVLEGIWEDSPELNPGEPHNYWRTDDFSITLFGDQARSFNEIVQRIYFKGDIGPRKVEDNFKKRNIKKKIREYFNKLCRRALKDQKYPQDLVDSTIQSEWEEWRNDFVENTQIFPLLTLIQNLRVPENFTFGGFEFQNLNCSSYGELRDEIESIQVHDDYPEWYEEQFFEYFERHFDPDNHDAPACIVKKEIEHFGKKDVQDFFLDRVGELVDSLWFLGSYLIPEHYKAHVDIKGRLNQGQCPILVFYNDGDGVSIGREPQGYRFNYEIDEEYLSDAEELHKDYIGEILALEPEHRSKLNQRLLKAISWFSEGLREQNDDMKFSKHVIGLEGLAVGKSTENGSYTEAFKKRMGALFAKDREGYSAIKKRSGQVYSVRGDIVHRADTDHRWDYVNRAEYLLKQAIPIFIQRLKEEDWETSVDFENWCKGTYRKYERNLDNG